MIAQRYRIRKEIDETWTVFDLFTGLPAELEGHPSIDLEMEYAQEVAGILNAHQNGRLARRDISNT